ncbi:hypothetical protein [Oxalobacter formigenes]|nr:hypothetical protein [Oxalobacter formigenes]ARQ46665.1 hypothetical protein BRW83_1925 [Oxalobacter formigenes]MCZ4063798.1 hypothetical protein [Oxalobacter formigenes]QDX32686.1 hypothetical protein FPZ51_03315 [Oxalobacter formigenes]WAW07536.1 hypothetical protein NB638_08370 [Oxalobacter formigenes]
MDNQLPEIIEFTGTGITEGDFKVTLNKLLLYLNELLGSNGQKLNLIPSGIISMWSGAANAIPSGWTLCNGENGTPDMRDKFIVGAGGSYAVGETGGAASSSINGVTGATTLTVDQMPSHNHTVGQAYADAIGPNIATTDSSSSSYSPFASVKNTGGSLPHSHSISGSVPTLPPFYALAFIMKL